MAILELLHPADAGSPNDRPTPEEIAVIARHEHLTLAEAAERGAAMLDEPWGHAAIRQMVWDRLEEVRRIGDEKEAIRLTDLYRRTCRRLTSRYDRRRSPTRKLHPFPCPDKL